LRLHHTLFAVLGLTAIIAPCRQTLAQEETQPGASARAECARAYEASQEQRNSGQLISARDTLRSCAQASCPEFIRTDCATWLIEIQDELPTLVFAASSRGRAPSRVRITVDGRELSSGLDGQAVELDPGQYDFEFQAAGMQPVQRRLVVARGERNRLIQIDLEPLVSEPNPGQPRGQSERLSGERERSPKTIPRSLVLPGILAGAGVAGLAGFVGVGASARTRENQLKHTCSPNCRDDLVAAVRTRYLVADLSLGVGIASLVLGTYFFFDQSSAPRAHAHPPRLALMARPGAATLVYQGELE
jgi:hypothetical protein